MSNLVIATGPQLLERLTEVRRALSECHDFAEVRDLRDQAEAIRHYMKSASMGLDLQNQAATVKLLCEHQAGRMLKKILRHGGDRRPGKHDGKSQLAELGIRNNMQSSRLQRIASIPEVDLMHFVERCINEHREVTTQGALRYVQSLTEKSETPAADTSPFRAIADGLRCLAANGKRFSCLYLDPPWRAPRRAKVTRLRKQLASLPIQAVTAGCAHLHLWVLPELLKDGLAILEAWGFRYESSLVRRRQPPEFGEYWLRAHRLLLLGVKGQLPFRDTSLSSWFDDGDFLGSSGTTQIHSLLATASPPPYLDVFAEKTAGVWVAPMSSGGEGK
jgi:hypothetical protein